MSSENADEMTLATLPAEIKRLVIREVEQGSKGKLRFVRFTIDVIPKLQSVSIRQQRALRDAYASDSYHEISEISENVSNISKGSEETRIALCGQFMHRLGRFYEIKVLKLLFTKLFPNAFDDLMWIVGDVPVRN
ncbi:hypothetical protein PENTCL1PPCAC_900, partial [Pristionchus entomophagus]